MTSVVYSNRTLNAAGIKAMRQAKERPDDWLSRKEAATYLQRIGCPITVRSLEKRAVNNNEGRGPSFTRVGWRTVKYQRRDLDVWAYAQTTRVP